MPMKPKLFNRIQLDRYELKENPEYNLTIHNVWLHESTHMIKVTTPYDVKEFYGTDPKVLIHSGKTLLLDMHDRDTRLF